MPKYILLLVVFLVTTVLARTTLYPTAMGEASFCFNCPVEGNHCYLLNLEGKQECLKESNGTNIMDSCTSQDTFFNYNNNNYTAKPEFVNGKCKVELGMIIPGKSKNGPVCKTEEYATACVYYVGDNDAPPSSNDIVTSNSSGLKLFLPCVFLIILTSLTLL